VVSHELESLARLCEKAVWMDHGKVRQVGPVNQIIEAYTQAVRNNKNQAA
jgi:ABC-type polysaccharide/polyol phosphate transport system ATPase subunit